MGPLSRLVGKPPLSPWLSRNVLPLTQAGNDTNSAISLTEIFDRMFFYMCNSLGFGVQKAKNGDRGTIVFTATLSVSNYMVVDDVCCLYLCRFVGFRGVSAIPTPQISWHKTLSVRFCLLCHLLCTKSNKYMLTPAYAFFVNAEKNYLCRSPCEHYGSRPSRFAQMTTSTNRFIYV